VTGLHQLVWLQLEDGLGLWLVAVRNATTLQPALLGLTPHMARIMAMSSEHIQHCAALLGSCALMGRDAYVAQYHAVRILILFCPFHALTLCKSFCCLINLLPGALCLEQSSVDMGEAVYLSTWDAPAVTCSCTLAAGAVLNLHRRPGQPK
jgi:hypothetical protein